MANIVTEHALGVEEVLEEIWYELIDNTNIYINQIQAEWDAKDQARADRMGIPYSTIFIEEVDSKNFNLGDIPSLVDQDYLGRKSNYPNICVTPGRIGVDPESNRSDHDIYQQTVTIHALVKANKSEGPLVCYHRAIRTAEAINRVIKNSSQLSHKISSLPNPFQGQFSDVFVMQPDEGHGEDWYWRAIGLDYNIKTYSL